MPSIDPFAIPQYGTCLRVSEQNSVWREILHLATKKVYPRGSFSLRNNGKSFHFLNSGLARLTRVNAAGDECFSLVFGSGMIFSELAAISQPYKDGPLVADVFFLALEPCEIYSFKIELLSDRDFILEYPHLMSNILRSVAYKAFTSFAKETDVKILDPTTRVCRLFYQMYKDAGAEEFCPYMSQGDVGKLLGIPRGTLVRVLHKLREEKVLGQFTKKCLKLDNIEKLSLLAKF